MSTPGSIGPQKPISEIQGPTQGQPAKKTSPIVQKMGAAFSKASSGVNSAKQWASSKAGAIKAKVRPTKPAKGAGLMSGPSPRSGPDPKAVAAAPLPFPLAGSYSPAPVRNQYTDAPSRDAPSRDASYSPAPHLDPADAEAAKANSSAPASTGYTAATSHYSNVGLSAPSLDYANSGFGSDSTTDRASQDLFDSTAAGIAYGILLPNQQQSTYSPAPQKQGDYVNLPPQQQSTYARAPHQLTPGERDKALRETRNAPIARIDVYAKERNAAKTRQDVQTSAKMALGVFEKEVINKRKKASLTQTYKRNNEILEFIADGPVKIAIQDKMKEEMNNKMIEKQNQLLKQMRSNKSEITTRDAAVAFDQMEAAVNNINLTDTQKNELKNRLEEVRKNLLDQGLVNRKEMQTKSSSNKAVQTALKWKREGKDSTPSKLIMQAITRDLALAHLGQTKGNEELKEFIEYYGSEQLGKMMDSNKGAARFKEYLNDYTSKFMRPEKPSLPKRDSSEIIDATAPDTPSTKTGDKVDAPPPKPPFPNSSTKTGDKVDAPPPKPRMKKAPPEPVARREKTPEERAADRAADLEQDGEVIP